jgi:DNA modification methylase
MTPYYEEPGITIYHGDCREVLPCVGCVDLLLTDPPYAIQKGGNWIAKIRPTYRKIETSLSGGCDFTFLIGVSAWMVFCNKDQLRELLTLAWDHETWALLTWIKTNPTPLTNENYLPDTEYIVHAYQKGCLFGDYHDRGKWFMSGVNDWPRASDHPTEKPLRLIHKLIRLGTTDGSTILDPFMGSGTTLRAAKNLGRQAIGIEIEERYCEIAVNRLRQGVLPLAIGE